MAPSPALRGRLSALADVVWLRSVPAIAGVLYFTQALQTFKLFILVYY